MTPAAVPVAAAVIMAVPNYKWTTHDFIEGQAEARFSVAFIFSKKTQTKIQTNKQKIFKNGDDE